MLRLKTIVYLDSWKNYRERFGYPCIGWEEKLPDEVWVGDRYALKKARQDLPGTKVVLRHNEYLGDIVQRCRLLSRVCDSRTILFMSDATPGIEKKLLELLRALEQRQRCRKIVIRFHPVDDRSRYDAVISENPHFKITKSEEKDIAKDLARARIVIGTETAGLAASILAGRKTICLAHRHEKPFLPYPGIIRINRARDVLKLI